MLLLCIRTTLNNNDMKAKATRLPDALAEDVEKISGHHLISEGKFIALAIQRLVAEVRKTGRLPLPDFNETAEREAASA